MPEPAQVPAMEYQGKPATKTETRDGPSPVGSEIESDNGQVVVNLVILAASDAVVAANQYNKPPTEGQSVDVNYSTAQNHDSGKRKTK